MRAITQDAYGEADVLELREVDRPVPGRGEVLLRVRAAGVDPGVWHLMAGLPYLVRLGFGLRGPKTAVRGLDVAGVVEAVGADVTRFRPGDEVFGEGVGTFAEYACARQDRLVRKPANITFEQAAAVPVSGLAALQGLRDAGKVRAGQSVLVIGAAGGIGTFAVQLAKAWGAEVTGVCSTGKMALVLEIGADDVLDYTREALDARGRRYDVVLDTAGVRSLKELRKVLAPKGTLVLAGGEGGGKWFGAVMGRSLRAVLLSPFVGQNLKGLLSLPKVADLEYLREVLEAGTVVPVIERTYPLAEVPEAVRHLAAGRARGKVVISL